MASGHECRANRPNTWLLRPLLQSEDSPCQPGAVHTWPFASFRVRTTIRSLRRKADINRQAEPAGSVENDPERTWVVPDFCGACCRPYRLFVEAAAVRLIT